MSETIDLPGFGKTKKTTAYALGGGLALVALIAWYRSKNATPTPVTSASTSTDTTAAAPSLAAYTDPSLYGGGTAGYVGDGGGSYGSGSSTPGAFTTNGQWAQAAEDYLVNTVGGDSNAVAAALGKYITGQAVSTDQVTIIEQAIAFAGYPPVNGPDGYPPSYRTGSAPPPPPTNVPTNIPTAGFVKVTRTATWDDLAKSYDVFAGSGRALYEFNLLPGKHQANSYAAVQASWPTIHAKPSWEVALPKRGLKVTLPVVGTVTS